MKNIDKLKAIDEWQDGGGIPLMCSHCKSELHGNIDSVSYEVILSCPQGHIQEEVPNEVYERYKKLHDV